MIPNSEQPKIIQRAYDETLFNQLIQGGVDIILAKILAARPQTTHPKGVWGIYSPELKDLDSPFLLKDIDKSIERIIRAIENKEIIGLETDHDCDGQTSHAVLYQSFVNILGVPKNNILSFIGHRMEEGYGLSDKLADRILNANPRPSLIITADNGSSDELRIQKLKSEGIDVIVTDHHHLPENGPPKSAYACINPTREDCNYPDPYIAGCMVAWLLMAGVRNKILKNKPHLKLPPMTEVLDFVAVGTVADCVSLARSVNNRAVVQYGLKKIQQYKRSCWQAIKPLLGEKGLNSQDLGFLIGPMLNSDGRLGDAFQSINFLLSEDILEAESWAKSLWQANQTRKSIQKTMTEKAMAQAHKQVEQGRNGLVIYLKDGHAGVHGISASRIKDHFGRPCIIFSPKQNQKGILTGSARSIDDVHMRDVLQNIHTQNQDLLLSFGGHAGAAGLSIELKNLDLFKIQFEQSIQKLSNQNTYFGPVIYSDGEISSENIRLDVVKKIESLEPFGREFDVPLFEIQAEVVSFKLIGQDGNHLKLFLSLSNSAKKQGVDAVWFNAIDLNTGDIPVNSRETYRFIAQMQENVFRGVSKLQLMISGLVC